MPCAEKNWLGVYSRRSSSWDVPLGKESADPKCTWGDEIIAVATDGSGKVWRFAHHRSIAHTRGPFPADNRGYNSWDGPRGNVPQDCRCFLFTSNWEETVGKDDRGRFREDAFIVKLAARQ